jgi:hypothetical protein
MILMHMCFIKSLADRRNFEMAVYLSFERLSKDYSIALHLYGKEAITKLLS